MDVCSEVLWEILVVQAVRFFSLIGILNLLGEGFNIIYVTVLVFTVAKYSDFKVVSDMVNKYIKKESRGKGKELERWYN